MESLWNDVSLPQFSALESDVRTDVLIIGGGIAGILTAHALRRAGVDCILTEAKTICSGITKNTTAKITSQHGFIYNKLMKDVGAEKAKLYYEANERAIKKYRELCRDIDCDFEEKDSFVYALDTPKEMERELKTLRLLNIPEKFVGSTHLPVKALGAVCFPDQAQFHPLKFIKHIAKDLPIYEHTEVLKIENGTAITSAHKIKAKKIVVATHFPFLNKHGLYFLKMYQERAYVIALSGAENVSGMYIDGAKGGLSFRNYRDMLLIGCGAHRTGKQSDGWKAAEEFAKRHYPNAKIEYRFSTQDCMTPDNIPYIGLYSKSTPDLYVATGFNKWGMTSSMVAAEILRDEICGRENKYSSLFSPSRSFLKSQVALNAIESAVNLLTPTAPRCPHLGCALKWNAKEHSWDCPCHGSRFTEEGKLIDGPAKRGIGRKKP